MDPNSAHTRRDEVQVVDVREPEEWLAGHVDGAVHIPMGELSHRQGELATDRQIVTVCRSGNRSGVAATALQEAGYRAENLEGGMEAWEKAGLPFVAEDGGEPHVA